MINEASLDLLDFRHYCFCDITYVCAFVQSRTSHLHTYDWDLRNKLADSNGKKARDDSVRVGEMKRKSWAEDQAGAFWWDGAGQATCHLHLHRLKTGWMVTQLSRLTSWTSLEVRKSEWPIQSPMPYLVVNTRFFFKVTFIKLQALAIWIWTTSQSLTERGQG